MQNLLIGYKRKTLSPRVAFKIDIRKAFDSIRWETIREFLSATGFPNLFIEWIMQCVSTPHFIVSINGVHNGFFKGARGVRQGDPLS
ncbi:reverse transcriptase domain-containing protein, partial [Serratia marcescens]